MGWPRDDFEGLQASFGSLELGLDLFAKGNPASLHLRVSFEVLPDRLEVMMEVTNQVLAGIARADDLRPQQPQIRTRPPAPHPPTANLCQGRPAPGRDGVNLPASFST